MKIHKELSVVSGLLCLLLTLGILPVLVWHSWGVLSGIARVSLLGFGIADLALWSSARWSASGPTPLIRSVALACKAALAGLLLICAASVIALHAGDQRKSVAADRAAAAEARRLATIAEHAERLASSSGRSVAREFVEAAGASGTAGSSLLAAEASAADAWMGYLPDWWSTIGIIALPPLAGLAVLVLLSGVIALTAGESSPITATRETEVVDGLPERRVGFSTPATGYLNFRRPAPAPTPAAEVPASGGSDLDGIRYERKRDGRVEVWQVDASARRGKRYLTSFSGALPAAEQSERVRAAIARREVTA